MLANKPVLAANWKMNPTTAGEAAALVQGITEAARSQDRVTIAIFPPFVWLLGVHELLEGTGIELGAQGYDQTCTLDGQPSVALSIYQLPGSNALEVSKSVKDKLSEGQIKDVQLVTLDGGQQAVALRILEHGGGGIAEFAIRWKPAPILVAAA